MDRGECCSDTPLDEIRGVTDQLSETLDRLKRRLENVPGRNHSRGQRHTPSRKDETASGDRRAS